MTTSGPPTADHRQRLLNALAVVISREGYGGTKIQDVVREAKVSLRTFYAEFGNKEECFLALYEQVTEALLTLISRSVTFESPSWREEMEKGFAAHFAALQSAPRLTYASLVELATLSDHARRTRQAQVDRLITVLCAQVEEGRRRYPEVRSRPLTPMMARALMGGVGELTMELVVRGEYDRLTELVEVSTELMWCVVTNVPAPAEASAEPASAAADPPAESGVRR